MTKKALSSVFVVLVLFAVVIILFKTKIGNKILSNESKAIQGQTSAKELATKIIQLGGPFKVKELDEKKIEITLPNGDKKIIDLNHTVSMDQAAANTEPFDPSKLKIISHPQLVAKIEEMNKHGASIIYEKDHHGNLVIDAKKSRFPKAAFKDENKMQTDVMHSIELKTKDKENLLRVVDELKKKQPDLPVEIKGNQLILHKPKLK